MEKPIAVYLGKLTDKVNQMFQSSSKDQTNSEDRELVQCVQNAMEEWCQAEKLFENISEPELVDYAIYKIEASKKRYMYLLKKAKEKGIRLDL